MRVRFSSKIIPSRPHNVIPGLVPGIQASTNALVVCGCESATAISSMPRVARWVPGTRPGMTAVGWREWTHTLERHPGEGRDPRKPVGSCSI